MNQQNSNIIKVLTSPYEILSPEDMEAARAAAYGKLGPIGPIKHWTQGMDHVLRAISGRMELNKINEERQAGASATADAIKGYFAPSGSSGRRSEESPTSPNKSVALNSPAITNNSESAASPLASSFLDAVKGFEGKNLKAYPDYKQHSIGYGTKAKSADEIIDDAEAERRLGIELGQARTMVEAFAPNLDEGSKAALTSLTFNAGPGWMQSGLGKAIKSGDIDGAKKIFTRYIHADGKPLPGLINRRNKEVQWFGNKDPFGAGRMGLGGPIQQRGVQSIPMDNLDQPPLTSPEAWPIETQFNPDQFMQPPPESLEYQPPQQITQPPLESPESWQISTQAAPPIPPDPTRNPNRGANIASVDQFMQPPPESPESWLTQVMPSQEVASADMGRTSDFASLPPLEEINIDQPNLAGPQIAPELTQESWGTEVNPQMAGEEVAGVPEGVQEAPQQAMPPTASAMAPQQAAMAPQQQARGPQMGGMPNGRLPFGSVNQDQLDAILRNPRVPPELKMMLVRDAIAKSATQKFDTGMGTLIYNPRDGSYGFVPKSEIKQAEVDGIKYNEVISGEMGPNGVGARRIPIGGGTGGGGSQSVSPSAQFNAPRSDAPMQSAQPQQQPQQRPSGDKKSDIVDKYNNKRTNRIGDQEFNENWDTDTKIRYAADRKAMAKEREENIKATYAMMKDPLEKAQKDGALARETQDLATKWRGIANHPANEKVYSGMGAELGYDIIRTYNEAAKMANSFLGKNQFKPFAEEQVTIATLRNALAVQMAATLARRSDPNPTIKQFESFLKTVPGLNVDTMTANAMADMMEAVAVRDRSVASIAAKLKDKTDFIDAVSEFDSEVGLDMDDIMKKIVSPSRVQGELRGTIDEPSATPKAKAKRYIPGTGWVE